MRPAVLWDCYALSILLFGTHFDNCGKRADAQIEELVADNQRAAAIRSEFMAIFQQL